MQKHEESVIYETVEQCTLLQVCGAPFIINFIYVSIYLNLTTPTLTTNVSRRVTNFCGEISFKWRFYVIE